MTCQVAPKHMLSSHNVHMYVFVRVLSSNVGINAPLLSTIVLDYLMRKVAATPKGHDIPLVGAILQTSVTDIPGDILSMQMT